MTAVASVAAIRRVHLVRPAVHEDDRGVFVETYRQEWFLDGREMVQANRADRRAGSVVGLHYHLYQTDYWHVPAGTARVVLHDLRAGSPTQGATWSVDLGGEANGDLRYGGVYIPPGVAHGFAAVTDCTLCYLVDGYYNPVDELGVAWDDPDIGADWGVEAPVLSARDRANPRRAELSGLDLPRWRTRTD